VLLRERRSDGPDGRALLWQRGDVLYMVSVQNTTSERLVQIAESMF